MPQQSLDVVAAVITRGPDVLACRRSEGRRMAGQWEFPGGKVEPGEDHREALRREILEELSVDVHIGELLVIEDRPDLGVRLSCYRASLTGDAPSTSTDHDELRWVRGEDLRSLDWAEPDRPAVALLMKAEGRS